MFLKLLGDSFDLVILCKKKTLIYIIYGILNSFKFELCIELSYSKKQSWC